jgi:CheY-like chemotaxis protein
MASVLVIDPNEDFALNIAEALRQKGIAITAVVDGKEGVDIAQRSRPDAIVLCLEQRGMNGLSICGRLRRDDTTRKIPLVLTSNDATNFAANKNSKSKADAYLAKPFSAGELFGVLNRLIDTTSRDTVSDLSLPPKLKSIQDAQAPTSPSAVSNGRGNSTADLLATDLPMPNPRDDSGADLDWMVKLRQSIARRDTQIAELRAKVDEASRAQASIAEKERRYQEEMQKIGRERDETIKVNMSMQEKLTSIRLDLDDSKKRHAKDKKALEDRAAAISKQGEEKLAALQKTSDEKLAALKKQTDDTIGTLKHQLDDTTQREQEKGASLDAAQRQIKTLTQKLDETTRNYDTTKKSASDLKSQVEKQANRIAQLEDDLKRALADGDAKRQAIAKLEDQLAKSQAESAKEVFALTEDLKAAQAGSEAKSKTIVMRDDELAKQKANYEKRLASMDESLKKANNTLEAKQKQAAKDIEARDASITGLKQKLSALADEMEREKAEHEKVMHAANDMHAKEMNRVREELQVKAVQSDNQHREVVKKLEAEKGLIENERQALETQAIDLGKRMASIEKQLGLTRQQVTEHEKKSADLVERANAADGRAAELERQLADGRRAKHQLEEQLREMTKLFGSVRDTVEKLSSKD